MSGVHFIQQCPTCGRRVQVQLGLMGRQIACEHCHGTFTAGADDPESTATLNRATELLEDYETIRLNETSVEDVW